MRGDTVDLARSEQGRHVVTSFSLTFSLLSYFSALIDVIIPIEIFARFRRRHCPAVVDITVSRITERRALIIGSTAQVGIATIADRALIESGTSAHINDATVIRLRPQNGAENGNGKVSTQTHSYQRILLPVIMIHLIDLLPTI